MIEEVGNSHMWTDLDQLINYLNMMKHNDNVPVKQLIDYIITGLQNTKKHNYQLIKNTVPLSLLKTGDKFKFDDKELDDDDDIYYLIDKTEKCSSAWNDTKKIPFKTNLERMVVKLPETKMYHEL